MIGESVGFVRAVRVAGSGRELLPTLEPVDLVIENGLIADIAPTGNLKPTGLVLDGEGGWILPGLWDHHVHVLQWALAADRVPLGEVASARDAAAIMGLAPESDGRRIGSGFRDGLWPDVPNLRMLDATTGEVPTYLINADVHSVWMNSAAFRREGFEPVASGILREEDAFEISRRLNAVEPGIADRSVERMANAAAARGIVGLVDLDMTWNDEPWQRRVAGGFDTLRISYGTYPQHLDRAIAEGLRTGDSVRGATHDLVRVGPLKAITDGSLGTRTAACAHHYPGEVDNHGLLTIAPDELVEMMTRATAAGLECAIHAIGDIANAHALDAYALTGAVGTIEHAQLVAHSDIPRFARLGVAASVQPEHALDDRDMTDAIWAEQSAQPYPLRALADSGANLRFGSDAPVAPLDPWAAMASAVFRTRDGRDAWQPHERVSIETAIAASTVGGSTAPAEIAPGALADLVVVGADPLTADERGLRSMPVRATLLAGRVTHGA
ncbi:amidohydrolase family protein [Microbacterium sp. Kw_RZR3]|uniref:amidohydrolase n=1 Tax=unclassified Microbacterium TaxID=2609290 RepID=UPI0023DCBC8C|nr:amidohydrolase family protein [Microbacterium sp. Kw_RZR3]MDF2047234.1 amidohydrolase family protein [Microbacterium sp. Kw_RZR3]MDF2918288.1 putative metal-dependent hydrolase with the TIM-barrel fold [Microbacterium sp.]